MIKYNFKKGTVKSKKECFLILPGAYQLASTWDQIIFQIRNRKEVDCFVIDYSMICADAKDQKQALTTIRKRIDRYLLKYERVVLVGHSLGSVIISNLISEIPYLRSKIDIYLFCIPVGVNKRLVQIRQYISDFFIGLNDYVSIEKLPRLIRGNFLISYRKNKLINLVEDKNIFDNLISVKNKTGISLGVSYFDPYTKRVRFYNRLINCNNSDLKLKVNNFGFSGHIPHIVKQKRFLDWIIN